MEIGGSHKGVNETASYCDTENAKQPGSRDLRAIVTTTVKLNALGKVTLGLNQPNPVIECTNDFLRYRLHGDHVRSVREDREVVGGAAERSG